MERADEPALLIGGHHQQGAHGREDRPAYNSAGGLRSDARGVASPARCSATSSGPRSSPSGGGVPRDRGAARVGAALLTALKPRGGAREPLRPTGAPTRRARRTARCTRSAITHSAISQAISTGRRCFAPGAEGHLPADLRDPSVVRSRGACTATPRRCSSGSSPSAGSAPTPSSAVAGERDRRRHRRVRGRGPGEPLAMLHTLRQQMERDAAHPNSRSRTSSRGTLAWRTMSAPSPSRRPSRARARRAVRTRQRRLQRDSVQGAVRPPSRGLRRAAA